MMQFNESSMKIDIEYFTLYGLTKRLKIPKPDEHPYVDFERAKELKLMT